MHPYTNSLVAAGPLLDPKIRETRERMILQGDIPSNVDLPSGCRFNTRCPFAQEKCKMDSPELSELELGHEVACFYPVQNEKKQLIEVMS